MTRTAPVLSLIVSSLLALLFMLLPNPLHAAQGSKTEILPVQKAAPAAVAIETAGSEVELRRQMRTKNGVAELHTGTILFSQAPTGRFGFIAPQVLGMALVMQSPDLAFERAAPTANAYEIHKLADGSGMLVGFMRGDLVPHVTPSQRPKNIRIALYSNPSEKASVIVAVPLVKLMVDRMPIRLDPKRPDSPVMLDMDLQGSANRKSPQMGQ
ncbi:MAG: hypothetical protein ACT4OL_04400 [Nitrospiraceae bacterium]